MAHANVNKISMVDQNILIKWINYNNIQNLKEKKSYKTGTLE